MLLKNLGGKMSLLEAIFLGFIQGVGEFLPISSSGHLAIAEELLGAKDIPLLFDILLHVATFCAVIIVFKKRIGELFCVLGRFLSKKSLDSDKNDQKLIVSLITATFFTGIIGLLLKDVTKNASPFFISCCLVVSGFLLVISSFINKKRSLEQPSKQNSQPGFAQGIIVGIAQGIGVIPGISRSGITISASLIAGVDRKSAGEYSFLLSIFAILGAFILELKSADNLLDSISILPLAAGMFTAFAVGFVSLKFFLGLINRGKLAWFAWYLIPAGISLAFYFAKLR